MLVFSFALASASDPAQGPILAAGVLWASTLFTGTVALARVLDRERENEAIRSLLLSPAPRAAIYVGKLIATSLLMLAVESLLTVLVGVLFSTSSAARTGKATPAIERKTTTTNAKAARIARSALRFPMPTRADASRTAPSSAAVFSAALLRSRSREALLGALLFPIVIPVLLAASRATACLFDPLSPDLDPVSFWTRFLLATDVIYISLGLWVFEPVVSGD